MTALGTLLHAHMNSRATLAWRMAAGDRKAALAHLEAMCGQDTMLAEAIRHAGLRAAIKGGKPDYETLARTGGRYLACHPDHD